MKSFKKAMTTFLPLAVFVFFVGATFVSCAEEAQEFMPDVPKTAYFESFSGIIKEISDLHGIEDVAYSRKHVTVENQTGNRVRFIISTETYFIDGDKIRVGALVTGFYQADAPTAAIFPPQYAPEIMAVDQKGRQIKADLFGQDLVSADGLLKLNVSPNTQLVWKDDSTFNGVLANRKLIVFYEVSTKSIPAQTTPSKIIVFENPVALTSENLAQMDIIVEGKKIESPPAYLNKDELVMVSLKPIAEALGFDMVFDSEAQSGMFAGCVSFKPGEDNYLYLKKIPLMLGAAPELVNEEIYVPLNFFTDIVHLNNAYMFENQIVIDNNEKVK